MPPNRKSVATLTASLSNLDLQSALQPTFLPLTHPKAEAQHEQQQREQAKAQTSTSCASYWDWPCDEPVEQVDVLSLSNIESNLRHCDNANGKHSARLVPSHDDYWAEADQIVQDDDDQPPSLAVTQPQHKQGLSYWDWPAPQDARRSMIDMILEEEAARQAVSAAAIESTLVHNMPGNDSTHVYPTKASSGNYWAWESPVYASHTLDATHPNHKYWDWKTEDETTAAATSACLLQALMEYEAARQLLTAEHIVHQIQSQSKQTEHTETNADSDEYWNMSENLGDAYWEWEAPKQPPVATTTSYWVW
jgi:hypothetical protein